MRRVSKIGLMIAGLLAGFVPVQMGFAAFNISRHSLVVPGERDVTYLLYTPSGAAAETRYPLLFALPGAGGSLTNYNFADPAFQDLRDELDRNNVFVVIPDLGARHFMNDQAMRDLDGIMEAMFKHPQVDSHRVHLLGTSMGGGSALAYALHQPRRVRSVISHMGMTDFAIWANENRDYETALSDALGGSPDQVPEVYRMRSALENAECLRPIPVMLIHGSNDDTVLPSHSILLHRAIQAAHGTSVLKLVEGGTHDNSTMIGFGPEVVAFLESASCNTATQAASGEEEAESGPSLQPQFLQTTAGTRFGILGRKPAQPAPTLFVLASTPEATLGSDYFLQCGAVLAKQGYLCVSLDLPCHGQDHRPDEPEGLAGWRKRLDAGEDLMSGFIGRAEDVLDFLIAEKHADPERIAVCGTSRGGFAALHFAASEPRIRCVVAIAPVTKLSALKEFHAMQHPERAETLSVDTLSDRLINRGVWIAIGDQDQRVSTDATIAFARRLSSVAVEAKVSPQIDLLVLAEPGGHTTPPGVAALSAAWVAKQLDPKNHSKN